MLVAERENGFGPTEHPRRDISLGDEWSVTS
jgi:hypothetical protein